MPTEQLQKVTPWSLYYKYKHFRKMEKRKKKVLDVNLGCFHNARECKRWRANTALCPPSALCGFALIAAPLWILGSLALFKRNRSENIVFPNHLVQYCMDKGRASHADSIIGTTSAVTAWGYGTLLKWGTPAYTELFECSTAASF